MSKPQDTVLSDKKTEAVVAIQEAYSPEVLNILRRAYKNGKLTLEQILPRQVSDETACRIRDISATNNDAQRQKQSIQNRRWFTQPTGTGRREKSDFLPEMIQRDTVYRNSLSKKARDVYHALCAMSTLAPADSKGFRHRYIECTYNQLADEASCSEITVKRAMKTILRSRLAKRYQTGNTFIKFSRYEIPASYNQIIVWRAQGNGKH